jgi:DNA-binding transcriptional LysR family regulator
LKVFELQERKAALTPTGQLLYRRGKALLAEAEQPDTRIELYETVLGGTD